MFNFVFDRCVVGRPYPNLAPLSDVSNGYHNMGNEYPFIAPLRLMYYVDQHQYPINVIYLDTETVLPPDSFYPVGLAFFDYGIDYFGMLSDQVQQRCRAGELKILFYYHEGDNPHYEKVRLDSLCESHALPTNCYRFVSGNTEADSISGFVYFADHELFYWRNAVVRNGERVPGCEAHTRPRTRQFTLLSRIHKWWRASIVACLHRDGLLDNSYWSYGSVGIGDRPEDNPIELWPFEIQDYMQKFLDHAPYRCDDLTPEQHNAHYILVRQHFEDSYCQLVLETFFDAEQSNGAFLTEKTFKPIRQGQPFVVFGTPNSLATLKRLGYRTFDQYIDNSYDQELNNTERFKLLLSSVKKLAGQDLHLWYQQCLEDVKHNQDLFLSSKYDRLNNLRHQLLNK